VSPGGRLERNDSAATTVPAAAGRARRSTAVCIHAEYRT
jgi:hypothetical protein